MTLKVDNEMSIDEDKAEDKVASATRTVKSIKMDKSISGSSKAYNVS